MLAIFTRIGTIHASISGKAITIIQKHHPLLKGNVSVCIIESNDRKSCESCKNVIFAVENN
jgi:hypothetical protein